MSVAKHNVQKFYVVLNYTWTAPHMCRQAHTQYQMIHFDVSHYITTSEHASYHAGGMTQFTGKELTVKAPQVGTTAGSPASQCPGPRGYQLLPQPPSPHSKTPATPLPHLGWAEALLTQPEHTAACQHWMGCWLMGHWSWFRSCWMIWRMSCCVSVSRRMSGWWWWRCRCWCFCGASLRCCELCCCQGGFCQEMETCTDKATQ